MVTSEITLSVLGNSSSWKQIVKRFGVCCCGCNGHGASKSFSVQEFGRCKVEWHGIAHMLIHITNSDIMCKL